MTEIYISITRQRLEFESIDSSQREKDMIWNLTNYSYKDGTPIPDREIAYMMIVLLMVDHHSSSATISWILLCLASRSDIQVDLLEQ
jgi:sterol 14-demethylase